MTNLVSFVWTVREPTRLPSILTGLALHLSHFTVTNRRPESASWDIKIVNISQEAAASLIGKLGIDMTEHLEKIPP